MRQRRMDQRSCISLEEFWKARIDSLDPGSCLLRILRPDVVRFDGERPPSDRLGSDCCKGGSILTDYARSHDHCSLNVWIEPKGITL